MAESQRTGDDGSCDKVVSEMAALSVEPEEIDVEREQPVKDSNESAHPTVPIVCDTIDAVQAVPHWLVDTDIESTQGNDVTEDGDDSGTTTEGGADAPPTTPESCDVHTTSSEAGGGDGDVHPPGGDCGTYVHTTSSEPDTITNNLHMTPEGGDTVHSTRESGDTVQMSSVAEGNASVCGAPEGGASGSDNAEPDWSLEKNVGATIKKGIKHLLPFTSPSSKRKEVPPSGKDKEQQLPDPGSSYYSTEVKKDDGKVGKALFFTCCKTMVGERARCKTDLVNIRAQLNDMNFDVSAPINNASQDQMEKAIQGVCNSKHADYAMLVCVIISNADHGLIYPQEAPRFSITKLTEPLSSGRHPVWGGKPKIFILLTPFFEITTKKLGLGEKKEEMQIPSEADFLFLWSFVPESYTKRDDLQKLLKENSGDKEKLEIELKAFGLDADKRGQILKDSKKLINRHATAMTASLTCEHLVRELKTAGGRDLGAVFTQVINQVLGELKDHQEALERGKPMPTGQMIYQVSQLRKLLVLPSKK